MNDTLLQVLLLGGAFCGVMLGRKRYVLAAFAWAFVLVLVAAFCVGRAVGGGL